MRTDRHDEVNIRFRNFEKAPKIVVLLFHILAILLEYNNKIYFSDF